jgi:hypothetical protein
MKINFSLSGFISGIKIPVDVNSPEFEMSMIGKLIYLENYTEVGKITGIDVSRDLIFADVTDKEFKRQVLDSKGFNKCTFEIVGEKEK